MFQVVREGEDEESVHLSSWPEVPTLDFDSATVLAQMFTARVVVTQALEARDKAGIKVRQVLAKLTIPKTIPLPAAYAAVVADEVNVKNIVSEGDTLVLDTKLTPELEEEGLVRELVRTIQQYRKESGMKPGEPGSYSVPAENKVIAGKYREQIEKATNTTLKY